jgi:hypothetical protein
MKIGKLVLLPLALLGCLGLALYFIWPRNHVEIQLRETKWSPDGRCVAVVQLEVYNTAWVVNDAVYAVRLREATQKGAEGDLVMNVPVSYPDPEPSIDWRNSTLVITLANKQAYQYFVKSIDGVAVVVQRNGRVGKDTD